MKFRKLFIVGGPEFTDEGDFNTYMFFTNRKKVKDFINKTSDENAKDNIDPDEYKSKSKYLTALKKWKRDYKKDINIDVVKLL